MSYVIKLCAKTAKLEIASPGGGTVVVTREDVLQAAGGRNGCTGFQFSMILARYCNLEIGNLHQIVDPIFRHMKEQAASYPKVVARPEFETHLARMAWTATHRYLGGDRCGKCNGSGNLRSRITAKGQLPPKICPKCEGTGVSALSERELSKQAGLSRHVFMHHGWNEIGNEAVDYMRVQDQIGLKKIYVNLTKGYELSGEGLTS